MNDNKFADGLFIFPPNENAPDFVKMSASIAPEKFIAWLKQQPTNAKGFVNIQILESEKGTWYGKLNDYQPKPIDKPIENMEKSNDLPF